MKGLVMKRIFIPLFFAASLLLSFSSASLAGSPDIKPNPWMFYLGAFGGYYSADFTYGATYFSSFQTNNQEMFSDSFQHGFSGGGQAGVQYHFTSPYFVGLVFSGVMNSNKARLTELIQSEISLLFRGIQINHQFRVNSNYDLAAVFGIDITQRTQAYVKLGVTDGQLKDLVFATLTRTAPFPIRTLEQNQHKNIWGWVLGLGLSRDLNKWLSAFVEYDYYDYGRYNLDTLIRIPTIQSFFGTRDILNQNVAIHSSAFRLGLNVNFGNRFFDNRYMMNADNNFWMYLGVFAGSYYGDFGYGANYFSNRSGGNNQIINRDAIQQGVSGGVQLGVQYHFKTPYFVGFAFSSMMNANKARSSDGIDNAIQGVDSFDVNQEFRINANYDLALTPGADITPRTHVYAKLGGAFARFKDHFFATRAQEFPFPSPTFDNSESKTIWGWLLGAGLTYDISKCVSTFVEYDYYDYGSYNLQSFNNISFFAFAGQADRITQHVDINASMFRVGLNVNFGKNAITYKLLTQPAWVVYLGALGGYYSANFAYGANYFTALVSRPAFNGPANRVFNANIFQNGVSGGGQVGIQYHFRQPYFIGFVVSGMLNANKGRAVFLIDQSESPANAVFNFNDRLLINTNIDMAGVFGIDITMLTHLYAKLGASYGHLVHELFTNQGEFFNDISVFFQQTETRSLWGWMFGLGLSHDISKYLNVFGEFDHYSYGAYELNTVRTIAAPAGGVADLMTQHVRVHAFGLRVGLNVKFKL